MFMSDFTNEEKSRIDILYGTDFKDVTSDDVKLIIEWEKAKATENAIDSEANRKMTEEFNARIEASKAEADLAREKLKQLVSDAKKRYEDVSDNGK